MTNQIITLKLTEEQIQKLGDAFASNKSSKVPPYAYYQLKCEDCVITAYTSGKVVFQGKDAEISWVLQTQLNKLCVRLEIIVLFL